MDLRSVLLVLALGCQCFLAEETTEVAVKCNLEEKLGLIYEISQKAVEATTWDSQWKTLISDAWALIDSCSIPDYMSWTTIEKALNSAKNLIVLHARAIKLHFEVEKISPILDAFYDLVINFELDMKDWVLETCGGIEKSLQQVEVNVNAMSFTEVIMVLIEGIKNYFSLKGAALSIILNPMNIAVLLYFLGSIFPVWHMMY